MLFWCMINITLRILLCRPCMSAGTWTEAIAGMLGLGLAWGFKFDVYGAVLLCAAAVTSLELKKREELRLSELETMLAGAQLDALKTQLHPHFLFNALNSIVELIHQDPKRAADLLARLEEFLRITLQAENAQEVSLRKELDFVDCYLDMQRVRFPKRLTVRKDIDEQSMESRVPILILQPLIENAVRHGIARSPQPGEISIHSELREGTLRLMICDTGPGIPPAGGQVQEGIGLANTKRRLQHLYGKGFRFEMRNEDAGGLLVSLEIPSR
jgi:LytS/YehU family sensor histidine kinase